MSHRRWMTSRRVRRVPLFVGTAAVLALTAACGGGTTSGSSQPQGSSAPLTSSAAGKPTGSSTETTTKAAGSTVTVSDDAAKQLCDALRPQLSDWRVQGPTLGKISLNASVHEWALRNGGINIQVLGDKDVLDRITTKSCSDVRDQAISALEIPNLAAGLVG